MYKDCCPKCKGKNLDFISSLTEVEEGNVEYCLCSDCKEVFLNIDIEDDKICPKCKKGCLVVTRIEPLGEDTLIYTCNHCLKDFIGGSESEIK